jgi:hypothetical protein
MANLPSDLSNIKDPVLRSMNIGFRLGPEAVARAAGLSANPPQDAGMLQSLKRSLLSAAQLKADLGLLAVDDPGFVLAKTMVAAEAKHYPAAKDDDWRMGLGAISMAQDAQLVLKKLLMATAEEELLAAGEYDAQMAAEQIKKREGKGGGSGGDPPGQSAA